MPLKGGLREFSLPDLFQLIHFGKKNGTLVITNGDSKGYVCFRNGNIFFATHNWKRPPLGERLVQAGMVTDEQLQEALELQRSSRKEQRLGNILCELGYLSRESLEVFVEEQIRDAVFNLLRWTEGEFDFDPDEIFPEEDIGLSMSTEDLILEGSRRMDEWFQLEKKVPSLDSVFKMVKEPGKDASDMNLSSDEWLVLYHVDGESAVRDIIEKSGQSALVTCRALYGLVTAGLVTLAGEVHITPAVEDVGLEDEVVQVKDTKKPGRRSSAAQRLEDRLQNVQEEAERSARRVRKRPAKGKKKTGEREEEEDMVSLGDESEEAITVEEITLEEESEGSTKKGRKPRRRSAKPQGAAEKEETAEIITEPKVEEKQDRKRKPAVAGPPKAGTPAPGQSLVDYYKTLALQEATDSDTLTAFKETEEKKSGAERFKDSGELEEPAAEAPEEEEFEIDIGDDDRLETSEPEELPLKPGRRAAKGRVEPEEDLEEYPDAGEEEIISEDERPRRPRKRKRGAGNEAKPGKEPEEVLLGEPEPETEIVEEEEPSSMEIEDVEPAAAEAEIATVEAEEVDVSAPEVEDAPREEQAAVEEIVGEGDSGGEPPAAGTDQAAEEVSAVSEPPVEETEVPLVQEAPAVDEAPLPSEEEIEKLLQVTPPSRELSREELLAFDQPTYATRDASPGADASAPAEGSPTEGGSPAASGSAEEKTAEIPEGKEAADAQDVDNEGNGELGRIIQFGKPGVETRGEVVLEQPEPIVKAASIERISTAEDLKVSFETPQSQAAAEADVEEETMTSVIDEVVLPEDIPLVHDSVSSAEAEPEAAEEPEMPGATAGGFDVIGLDGSGANVIPIDSAKPVSAAEVLDVTPAPAYAEPEVPPHAETPPAEAYEAPPEAQPVEAYEAPVEEQSAEAYEAPAAETKVLPQAEVEEAVLTAETEAEELPAETYEAPDEQPPAEIYEPPETAEEYQAELDYIAGAGALPAEPEAPPEAAMEAGAHKAEPLGASPETAPPPDYAEEAYAALVEEEAVTGGAGPQVSDVETDEVAAWDAAAAEQGGAQPEPEEVSEFSGDAALIIADHAAEGFVEPPPVPSDEPLAEPVTADDYEHAGTLRELSEEAAQVPEEAVEEEPEVAEEPPTEVQEPEVVAEEFEDEGMLGSLKVSGKRDAGTSLVDLETFELEQELLELAGGETKKKKDRLPINEKPAKKKEKRGRGKSKGKEVDKGSVKKIIDDMKKM